MANDEFDDEVAPRTDDEPSVQRKLADRAALARPWLDRALLNLRVWFPFLRTPIMKARQVKYRSSDARSGMSWRVGLPQQCYACGSTEDLIRKKFTQQTRAFEAPSTILGGTVAGAALFLLLSILFGKLSFLILAILVLIMGSVYQFIKSWTEKVTITIWSCPEHLEELTPPEVVSHDDDLYVYLPHESLTEFARAELIASRKKEQKSRPPLSPVEAERKPSEPEPDEGEPPPPARPIGVRTELPPLKLEGEEDG